MLMSARLRPASAALLWALFLAFSGLAGGGCQAGRTFMLDAPTGTLAAGLSDRTPSDEPATVVLRHEPGSIALTPEQADYFRDELAKRLAKDRRLTVVTVPAGAAVPSRLSTPRIYRLDYRFVGLDPGNGPVRIGAAIIGLIGVPTGALGQGTLAVDAVLTQVAAPGMPLGSGGGAGPGGPDDSRVRFLCDGPIDGPGGSVKGGLETAAESVATFVMSLLPAAPSNEPPRPVDSGYNQHD